MTKKTQPYCSECGSTEITNDAIARWDNDKQEWALSSLLDNTDCDQCGGECTLRWSNGNPDELTAEELAAFQERLNQTSQ